MVAPRFKKPKLKGKLSGRFFAPFVAMGSRRSLLRTGLALAAFLAPAFTVFAACTEDRTLYLYYTHTRETAKITFKRNGQYDKQGLKELNWFLRDWRRNEETNMDPRLFDLVWEVYQKVHATGPIYVVSAYRSPQTNAMLRSRSKSVAKNSRHILGMAMDFYIPGVPLKTLRETAMKMQVGGVGYYPTSGSPFVHLDVGNVRAWPRMTQTQLASLFPQGKTLHVPANGKLLSAQGYNYAKSQWLKCHEVPCGNGVFDTAGPIRVASADTGSSTSKGSGKTLADLIFGGKNETAPSPAAAPDRIAVASISAPAPTPVPVPADLRSEAHPGPEIPSLAQQMATANQTTADLEADDDESGVDLTAPVPAAPLPRATAPAGQPAPRVLMTAAIDPQTAPTPTPEPALTAYAAPGTPKAGPEIGANPDAQRAVQMLIDTATANAETPPPSLNTKPGLVPTDTRTASLGPDLESFAALFEGLTRPAQGASSTRSEARKIALQAPDFDHIIGIFVDGQAMASDRYAVIFDIPDPDIDPVSDLGPYDTDIGFSAHPEGVLGIASFKTGPSPFKIRAKS